MKKILFNIFIVLIALVLVGCGQSDEKKLKSYLNKISIETEVTENFYLPSSVDGLNDHSISWESSNTKAIKVGNLATVDGANYYNAKVTRSLEDVEEFLQAFENGEYLEEAEESTEYVRNSANGQIDIFKNYEFEE